MIMMTRKTKSYAKAIFDLALRDGLLTKWQNILDILAEIACVCQRDDVLSSPKISVAEKLALFVDVTMEFAQAEILINLLVRGNALSILPEIASSYKKMVFAHNKILEAKVVSAYPLNEDELKQLTSVLERCYQSKVLLQTVVDRELIGGGVVYIKDHVIDYYVKGILRSLRNNLSKCGG